MWRERKNSPYKLAYKLPKLAVPSLLPGLAVPPAIAERCPATPRSGRNSIVVGRLGPTFSAFSSFLTRFVRRYRMRRRREGLRFASLVDSFMLNGMIRVCDLGSVPKFWVQPGHVSD